MGFVVCFAVLAISHKAAVLRYGGYEKRNLLVHTMLLLSVVLGGGLVLLWPMIRSFKVNISPTKLPYLKIILYASFLVVLVALMALLLQMSYSGVDMYRACLIDFGHVSDARPDTKAAGHKPPGKEAKVPNTPKNMTDNGEGDKSSKTRPPSPTDLLYDRAEKWGVMTLAEILEDPKGKQLYRCFLAQSFAEENLSFYDAVKEFKNISDGATRQSKIKEILELFQPYINISSTALAQIRKAAESDEPKVDTFALAEKEVGRMLESDQLPRFKRSEMLVKFLEGLLSKEEAERWNTSFESLLANQVGRYRFRQFLRSIHAEENLRFWEGVNDFRQLKKHKPQGMANMGKQIERQYLAEGCSNEVFLPFVVRQGIEKRLNENNVDETLFDEAIKHVEQVLRNDPYVRFLQSKEYQELLVR